MRPILLLLLTVFIWEGCSPSAPRTSQINRKVCKVDHVNEVIGDSGRVVIPNIFSPDMDGFNDIFAISIYLPNASLDSYALRITSGLGEETFSSQDPSEMFGGEDFNGNWGRLRVFDYILVITVDGTQYDFNGEVTAVRMVELYDGYGEEMHLMKHCDNCVWPDQIDPRRGAIYDTSQPTDDLCR